MINVRDLSFTYPGGTSAAVQNINFSVESGEIFGLLGPSGAGKTTIQKILLGLLSGYTGSVHLMDREASRLTAVIRQKIGVAFETPALYEKLSGEENLCFFAALQNGGQRGLETAVQAARKLGLEKDLHMRVGAYSKGMKIRLNYCRALVNDPVLLFLDEPGAGLDPLLQVRLREHILQQKHAGKTIILTTHNMELAEKLCDRLGIIARGRLRALDTPDRLKSAHGENAVEVHSEESDHIFQLEGIAQNRQFLTILESGKLRSIRTREASMEQVFLAVTNEE